MSNVFTGSKTLISFELAREYTQSLLGLPPSTVSTDLVEAYKYQVEIRALQRLLSSRRPSTVSPSSLPPNIPGMYFYRSTKQNETTEWRASTVVDAQEHLVRVKKTHPVAPPPLSTKACVPSLTLRGN